MKKHFLITLLTLSTLSTLNAKIDYSTFTNCKNISIQNEAISFSFEENYETMKTWNVRNLYSDGKQNYAISFYSTYNDYISNCNISKEDYFKIKRMLINKPFFQKSN
jgi:hypothetical protein